MFELAPPLLYKYRNFESSGRHLGLITDSEIWFARASDFNDPYDISFQYDFDGLHTDLAVEWARDAVRRHQPNLNAEEREARAITRVEELRSDPEACERAQRDFVEHNLNTFGICSLCASNDNLLLWAHYAHNHTGFCVGLSVDHLHAASMSLLPRKELLDLRQVRYSSTPPRPNFFRSMINMEDTNYLHDFIEIKSLDWSYEKEWRLVFWNHVNARMRLGFEPIQQVILGCRISQENTRRVLEHCRRLIPHASVLQAVTKQHEFGLEFRPVAS